MFVNNCSDTDVRIAYNDCDPKEVSIPLGGEVIISASSNIAFTATKANDKKYFLEVNEKCVW